MLGYQQNYGPQTGQYNNIKTTLTPAINAKVSAESSFKDYCLYQNSFSGHGGEAYQWTGIYWKRLASPQQRTGLERIAAKYLESNFPDKAGNDLACKASKYSILLLPELPEKPRAHIIPLRNGWLEIEKDGTIREAKPDKNLGITYVIKADLMPQQGIYQPSPLPANSLFRKFLETSLPAPQIRELLQEYCGYTLLNGVHLQKAQIWVGNGSNGKSVLLKILTALHEKSASIRLDKLEGFALTQLVGASLAISAETPRGNINEEVLKAVITGDPITVEPKHKPEFTYSPTAKWIIACNEFPRIGDKSNGVWRRVQIIEWNVEITESQSIHNLEEQIIEKELRLVLDWCLEGAQRLLMRGKFNEPESIKAANDRKRHENNNVAMFSDETHLTLASGNEYLIKDDLYTMYREYCSASGYSAHNKDNFFKQLYSLFKGINKEMKKSVKGKWIRVVPLHYKEEPAPLSAEEKHNEQLELERDIKSFGWM